ncbi:hypothetical protein CASFOL_017484 [Castilleja foliolosa]|uniref:Uncharacterized protein n=1 Tax=Castilleja foliolosa TaxID=1961234 RepID=A0ABD3DD05_9LAMI
MAPFIVVQYHRRKLTTPASTGHQPLSPSAALNSDDRLISPNYNQSIKDVSAIKKRRQQQKKKSPAVEENEASC